MLDFDRWFKRQQPAEQTAPAPELPGGLWDDTRQPGKLLYQCRACEQVREWGQEPGEFDADMAYCGSSPRCIP